MSPKPVISLFGPAIRTHLWLDLYKSLLSNQVPFELIFLGNNVPDFDLPDNMRFIYTEVKPAQCAEIGARYAIGEFLMNIADDIVFSHRALDLLYMTHLFYQKDNYIMTPRYALRGNVWPIEKLTFWDGNINAPIMAVCGLMKKEYWNMLGGIDKRFIALCWDLDLYMRSYQRGGRVIVCSDAYVSEIACDRPSLYNSFGLNVDRKLLDSLWTTSCQNREENEFYTICSQKGLLCKNRRLSVDAIEDPDILTVSQGPKGRWK